MNVPRAQLCAGQRVRELGLGGRDTDEGEVGVRAATEVEGYG